MKKHPVELLSETHGMSGIDFKGWLKDRSNAELDDLLSMGKYLIKFTREEQESREKETLKNVDITRLGFDTFPCFTFKDIQLWNDTYKLRTNILFTNDSALAQAIKSLETLNCVVFQASNINDIPSLLTLIKPVIEKNDVDSGYILIDTKTEKRLGWCSELIKYGLKVAIINN